jgi:hypothetical protein
MTMDHTHPDVWWDGMARIFPEIDALHAAGDVQGLQNIVALMPRWIAGTREAGRTGCPNVMALALEYARAALDTITPEQSAAPVEDGEEEDAADAWERQRRTAMVTGEEFPGF